MTVIWEGIASAFKVFFVDFTLPIGISVGAFIWALTILHILLNWILPFLKKEGGSDTGKKSK